jgi:hypothetical protein
MTALWRFGPIRAGVLAGLAMLAMPVQAQPDDLIDAALRSAARTFERAAGQLDGVSMGVSKAEYGDALTRGRFASAAWSATLDVRVARNESEHGLCAGFAAYVTPAIEQGAIVLTICPRFFLPGADALRETTVLHEMVHVVAGPDECRAMAYTAQIQVLASGTFQPVRDYWNKNNCQASRYRLPG